MGCNCKCDCNGHENTATTVVEGAPIVSNVSQQRGTVGESAVTAGQVTSETQPANKWWKFWAEETFNSLWIGDSHKINIDGKAKFKNRKNKGQESGNGGGQKATGLGGGPKRQGTWKKSARPPEKKVSWLENLFGFRRKEESSGNGGDKKVAGDGGVTAFEAAGRNNNLTAQKITDLADWFNYPQREQFLFNSEINEPMNGSSNTVDHINPVEVQGSEDIMGAESFNFPFQQKNADQYQSGDGRRWIQSKRGWSGSWFWQGSKMVATNFPEGTDPDNYSEPYLVIKTRPNWAAWYDGLYSIEFPNTAGYGDGTHQKLMATKNAGGGNNNKGRGAQMVLDAYYENYPSGWSYTSQGTGTHDGEVYVLGGQPWIDNTGELKVNGQTWEEHKEEVNQAMEGADFDRRMQREKEENKKPKETDYDYHARQIKIWEKKLKQGHAREEVKKYFDYHEAQMAHYSKGKGGRGKSGGQQGPQAPHQPGQAPMGGPNMFNTEQVIWPQFTQNISGQGRTFANTIHPGMVIPNPDNYPTPEGNSPWAPYVNIRTYGDILDAVYPPYPSAMEWARNPQNYKEYPSTDWYTP